MAMAENRYTRIEYYYWPSSVSIHNLQFPTKEEEDMVPVFTLGSFPFVNSSQTVNINLTLLARFMLKAIP